MLTVQDTGPGFLLVRSLLGSDWRAWAAPNCILTQTICTAPAWTPGDSVFLIAMWSHITLHATETLLIVSDHILASATFMQVAKVVRVDIECRVWTRFISLLGSVERDFPCSGLSGSLGARV